MNEKNYSLLAQASINIQADLKSSFLYFADLNNYAEWFPEVTQMKEVDNSPISTLNKAYEEKVILDESGNSTFILVQVKEFFENEKIITQAEFEPLLPQMTISCESINDKEIRIDFKFESRSQEEAFLEGDDFKFFKNLLSSRAGLGLKKLKETLER